MSTSSSEGPLGCGEGRKASQDGSQGLPLEPGSNRHVLKAGILGATGRENSGCQVWLEHVHNTLGRSVWQCGTRVLISGHKQSLQGADPAERKLMGIFRTITGELMGMS